MVSFNDGIDISFVAGATCATTTAIYRAVYMSAENTVSLVDTTTALGKFVGVTQDYAKSAGDAITVRVAGVTKGMLQLDSITAGDLVQVKVSTSTSQGQFKLGSIKAVNASASVQNVGRVIRGSQGGTGSVFSFLIQPDFSSAQTTTVSASA